MQFIPFSYLSFEQASYERDKPMPDELQGLVGPLPIKAKVNGLFLVGGKCVWIGGDVGLHGLKGANPRYLLGGWQELIGHF
jgi:hypothetical protein